MSYQQGIVTLDVDTCLWLTVLYPTAEEACRELSRHKLYLADLPTKDEFNEVASRLAQADEELTTGREHIEGLVDERGHLQE